MDFAEFPKIARLSRDVVVTEKIDGTNAQVFIRELPDDEVMPTDTPLVAVVGRLLLYAGSRSRWVTPKDDNYGFAAWVVAQADELSRLGAGAHFGEWWGRGIQRNYSQTERRFSLFNVNRWGDASVRPACCNVVPTLYAGPLEEHGVMKGVKAALHRLQNEGSVAAPGFMKPEGIVIFHPQGNVAFKKTFDKDDAGKGREPIASELTRAA